MEHELPFQYLCTVLVGRSTVSFQFLNGLNRRIIIYDLNLKTGVAFFSVFRA